MATQAHKLLAFLEYGFARARTYRLHFATRYLAMFMSLLFFYFLDRMFAHAGVTVIEGSSYFGFLLVGGAFSRYLDLAMRSFAENLREEMLQGTLEPMLLTATSTSLVLLAPSSWMLLEGTMLVFVQLGLGALLGADLGHANWPGAAVVSLASIASLLCYGILSASFTLAFKRSDPLNWLVGSIAYVFSGVFFPITFLPAWLRVVSYALPFTYALRGLRNALLRGAGWGELLPDIAILLGFTLVLLPLSLWALRSATQHLKRTGELTHY